MKKLLMLLAACLMVMGTAPNLHANVYPIPGSKMIVKITKGDAAKMLNVQLANLQDERTHVCLQDMEGKIWFSDYVWRETGYAKKFNLNNMPDGDYLFFVSNNKNSHMQMITMGERHIEFFRPMMVEPNKPVAVFASLDNKKRGKLITYITKQNENTIGVQLANLEGKAATIRINAVGEAVTFNETTEGKEGYARLLNTTGMIPGKYFLYVKTDKTTVVQFFDVTKEGVKLGNGQKFTPIRKGWATS